MYKNLRIFSHITGIIGAIISIFLLCREFPTTDVKLDYMGIIVGILALLVTLLVAWNIYSALGVERKFKEAMDEKVKHDKELRDDFDKFKDRISFRMESLKTRTSTQIEHIKAKMFSAENAYISLFNSTQAQVAALMEDNDYLQQYSHYQTALHALLQCNNFPSDIRANIKIILAEMEKLTELLAQHGEEMKDKIYCLCYEDQKEFVQNMEKISKSPREEFSFEDRQRFMKIAVKAKNIFDRHYDN